MDYIELAKLLLPNLEKTREDYESIYPKRQLSENAIVTRFAPSPTGFVHMGSLFTSFIDSTFARQTNGVFYLRIEDTDQKREVENGITGIINDLNSFNYQIDEGPQIGGNYAPYIQSQRKDIYQAYAFDLIKKGLAYPCFCTEEELSEMRQIQESKKNRIGYYGKYAKCRNLTMEEIKQKLDEKIPYTIRLKSQGKFENKIILNDLIKGKIEMPQNDIDVVLLKSDGIPTYHFAHAVDDHLMRTTHVLRGDEWVSSYPIHHELFKLLDFELPNFCHVAPLTKKEGETIRKLSKRKDPESAVSFYYEAGIPTEAIKLYLATLLNSDFELWYSQNSDKSISDFKFEFKKMSVGGSLFDIDKLMNISKIYFSKKSATDLYNETLEYLSKYDKDFYDLLLLYKDYTINVLNIEREIPRPRKDISSYSSVKKEISYMYDELFNDESYKDLQIKSFYSSKLLEDYINNYYNEHDDKQEWFNKIKELCPKYNFASETKEYKENPDKFIGSVADACELIRVSVTGRTMTPDLYEILKLLGKERIKQRIVSFKNIIKKWRDKI